MRASRGMGCINPAKVPGAKKSIAKPVVTRKVKKFDKGGSVNQHEGMSHGTAREPTIEELQAINPVKYGEPGLENVYPEALIGSGVPSSIAKLGRGVVSKVDPRIAHPITNRLYKDMFVDGRGEFEAGNTSREWGGRNVFSQKEIEDIKNTGYMLPREGGNSKSKYFTMSDNPKNHLRVRSENIPVGKPVRREHIELRDEETGKYNPLKKGGIIKAKKKAKGGLTGPLDNLVKAEIDFGRIGKTNKKLGK